MTKAEEIELIRQVKINSAVALVIEVCEEKLGRPLTPDNSKWLLGVLVAGKRELMKETGLNPEAIHSLVMERIKPKMMLMQKFTSAGISCEKEPIIQNAINTIRQVLEGDIKTNDDELLQQILNETGLEKNKLYNLFLSEAGIRYHDFVRGIRFEAVFKILAEKEEVISDDYQSISDDAGMPIKGSTLSIYFKKTMGISFSEFHKDIHDKAEEVLENHAKAYKKAIKGDTSKEDALEDVCDAIHSTALEILEETCLDEDAFLAKFQDHIGYEPPA